MYKDVVGVLDISNDGLCSKCVENGIEEAVEEKPKEELPKTEEDKMEETKDFFSKVVGVFVALVFAWWFFSGETEKHHVESKPYVENPTHISITSVGCTSKDDLNNATRAYMNGGISAFKHYDCILVLKGQPIKKIKSSFTTVQVLYTIGESEHLVWVGYDTIE